MLIKVLMNRLSLVFLIDLWYNGFIPCRGINICANGVTINEDYKLE